MSFQATDTALTDTASVSNSELFQLHTDDLIQDSSPEDGRPGSTLRGIAVAMLISLLVWALIGFAVFLLR